MAYYQNGITAAAAKDRFVTNMNGECDVLGKAMLTGGRKYGTTAKPKEGEEKLALLDRVLGSSVASMLAVNVFPVPGGPTRRSFRLGTRPWPLSLS